MKMTLRNADAVIRAAKLDGFGGDCGRVAIAINHVVFNGQGKYLVATNPPLNKKTGQFFFGHVVVEWRRRLFDATGIIEDEVGVEAWGMLDPEDPDTRDIVTYDEAHEGEVHYIDDVFGDQAAQEAAIQHGTSGRGRCSIRDAEKALREALAGT